MKISRSGMSYAGENGPDWLNDFLQDFANKKSESSTISEEIMSAFKENTVEGVVENYRNMVGLDQVKTASKKVAPFRPLSARHAQEEDEDNIILIIEKNPGIQRDIESLCRHSGGHKDHQSIINYLRKILGNKVSYTDDKLIDYIKEVKSKYQQNYVEQDADIGLVGTDHAAIEENTTADYITHGDKSF